MISNLLPDMGHFMCLPKASSLAVAFKLDVTFALSFERLSHGAAQSSFSAMAEPKDSIYKSIQDERFVDSLLCMNQLTPV